MFCRGPAQPALGRPQDRFSAAGSCASCSCASCVLQGAARPPSLAELIFCLRSVACLSSLGQTVLFAWFSSFPDADAKVCVCGGGERMGFNAFRYCCSSMRLSWSPEALERATTVASVLRFESPLPYLYPRPPAVQFSQSMCTPLYFLPALLLVLSFVGLILKFACW